MRLFGPFESGRNEESGSSQEGLVNRRKFLERVAAGIAATSSSQLGKLFADDQVATDVVSDQYAVLERKRAALEDTGRLTINAPNRDDRFSSLASIIEPDEYDSNMFPYRVDVSYNTGSPVGAGRDRKVRTGTNTFRHFGDFRSVDIEPKQAWIKRSNREIELPRDAYQLSIAYSEENGSPYINFEMDPNDLNRSEGYYYDYDSTVTMPNYPEELTEEQFFRVLQAYQNIREISNVNLGTGNTNCLSGSYAAINAANRFRVPYNLSLLVGQSDGDYLSQASREQALHAIVAAYFDDNYVLFDPQTVAPKVGTIPQFAPMTVGDTNTVNGIVLSEGNGIYYQGLNGLRNLVVKRTMRGPMRRATSLSPAASDYAQEMISQHNAECYNSRNIAMR